ncbi:hypothetical protein J6590_003212 [Homalodisca vitripennis]|nr:hypothetical protein J6590_003212 [Homalodisca vitripennis]
MFITQRFDEESPDRDPSGRHLLVIMIDDIHRLNPLDSDIVAALSWLPINLPRNVHIIGTTHSSPDILKLTPVQRERFKLPDCYIELPPVTVLNFSSTTDQERITPMIQHSFKKALSNVSL